MPPSESCESWRWPQELSVCRIGLRRRARGWDLQPTGIGQLDGIDPETYLSSVLRRIADHHINRTAELLPWNLFPATPSAEAA
jgi:hypothetical protein